MTVKNIKKQICPILKSQDVIKAAVFGSIAKGATTKNSDVDILIKYRKGSKKTLLDLVGLKFDLEKILKRKVDLLTYDSLHPLLKGTILDEQKVIYEKEPKIFLQHIIESIGAVEEYVQGVSKKEFHQNQQKQVSEILENLKGQAIFPTK